MKKTSFLKISFIFLISILFSFRTFSEIPEELKGIWNGDDRILFFDEEGNFSVILKTFYGWYYEEASFPENKKSEKRERNDSISSRPEHITVNAGKLSENIDVWNLTINYSEKESKIIPAAVTENGIYMNFLVRMDNSEPENQEENSSLNGYWQGFNTDSTIRISGTPDKNEIISWYKTDSSVYRLRFWKTEMKSEDEASASFTDGDQTFSVKKFIVSGGSTFTSAAGRGKRIRNVEKSENFPFEYSLDKTGNIMLIGKPVFVKAEKNDAESLKKIVNEANSRFAPLWPDPFEKKELDWHYDLINNLEKDNKIIQEVRKRQNDFGPRGKETSGK